MKGTQKLTGLFYRSKLYLKQASPTILTCLGAVGVIATAVLAVKSTPRASELIKADSRANHDGDPYAYTKLEAIQSCWKCYIPSTLVGISTIACIFGANVINQHNQASLTSAYALLSESYKQYKKAANSVYGEDADSRIMAEVAKEKYISAGGYSLYSPDLDDGEQALFYDWYSNRYFTSTMAAVINAEYHFNRNLTLRGEVLLNEFYDFLGIDGLDWGTLGWSLDDLMSGGIMWLDFENDHVELEDGMGCYIITPSIEPTFLC